ncbi:hypothetical protein LJC36_00275 [Desulfovibrio sp. OttesenSCG-928-C14]|nr:hypothetical protein [Desulfovibrio sp. OttesenSCG-928-C14]
MADRIDRRIIYIELEVPGGKKTYKGMSCEYTLTKTAGVAMNEAEIKIANMAKADRDYLVTATSPLQRPRQRKAVAVYAGYESSGVNRRFIGDVTQATVSQPPDIWLTMKAMTGYYQRGNIISRSAPAQSSLASLAGGVARDLGLSLDFQATDKSIANYSFTGAAMQQVAKLAEAGLVDVYVEDERLVVKDRGKALTGRRRKLSEASGMIGIPEVDEKGVKVRMLLDPHTTVGSALEIESVLNPAANGIFTVYKLRENCALRNTQFYLEAEALRPGLGGMYL